MMNSVGDGHVSNTESEEDISVSICKSMKEHNYSASPVVDVVEGDSNNHAYSSACNENFDDDELNDILQEQILLKKIKCLKEFRRSLACYRDPELDKVDYHIKPLTENDNNLQNEVKKIDNSACDNDSFGGDKILDSILTTDTTDSGQIFKNHNRLETLMKLSKASSLNVLMQAELLRLESVLTARLKENLKEQIEVRAEISRLKLLEKKNANKKRKKTSWYTSFGRPYFKDEQRYTCPKNEDAKLMKLKNQILTINLFQSRPWKIKEKYLLEEGVRKILVEEWANKFYERAKQLKNQLKNNTICDSNTKKQIISELEGINNKIELVEKKSLEELFSACNPDREFDWLKIAARDVPKHSSEECQRMWHLYVKPTVNKERFSNDEYNNLKKLIEKFGEQSWDIIAKQLNTSRTEFLCFFFYKKKLKKGRNNCGKWTKEEDDKLLQTVNANRIGDFIPWPKVAFYFEGRSLSQLYGRWTNSLNPDLKKGRFNKNEDRLILSYVRKYGENFSKISKLLGFRNTTQVRQRYFLRKMINFNVGRWSLEEDEMLLALVEKYGVSRWSDISKQFITRTRTQIRHRYTAILNFMKKYPNLGIADIRRGPRARSQHLIPVGASEVKAAYTGQENKMLSELVKESKIKNQSKKNHDIAITKLKCGRKKNNKRSKLDLKLIAYFKESFTADQLKLRTHYVKPDINKAAGALMLLCSYFKTSLILSGDEFEEAIKKLPKTLKAVVLRMVEDERGCDNFRAKLETITTNSVVSDSNDLMSVNRNTLCIDYLPVDPRETLVNDCDYLLSVNKKETEVLELTEDCERSKNPRVIPYFLPPNVITMIGCRSVMLVKGKILNSLAHKCTRPSFFSPNDTLLMKKNNLKFFTGYFSDDDEEVSDCDTDTNNSNCDTVVSNDKESLKLPVDSNIFLPFSPHCTDVSVPPSRLMTNLSSDRSNDLESSVTTSSLCISNETVHLLPSTSKECDSPSSPNLFSDTPILYELDNNKKTNGKCEDEILNVRTKRLTKQEAIDLWKERLMVLFGWPLALANHAPEFPDVENVSDTNEMDKSKKTCQKDNTNPTTDCTFSNKRSTKRQKPETSNSSQNFQLIDDKNQSKSLFHGASPIIDEVDKNECVSTDEKTSNIAGNEEPSTSNATEVQRRLTNQYKGKNKSGNRKNTTDFSEIISCESNVSQNSDKIRVDNTQETVNDLRSKRQRKSNKFLEEFHVYK